MEGFGGQTRLKKQGSSNRDTIREKLRAQCMERVRQQRAGLLLRLRSAGGIGGSHRVACMEEGEVVGLARGLVAGECGEGDSFMACVEGLASSIPGVEDTEEDGLSEEEYIGLMQYLEEAVVTELRKQEQEIIAQELFDQERAESNALAASHAEGHRVTCPVCMRDTLHSHRNVVFCGCGMRLSCQTEQVSLVQLESMLLDRFAAHTSSGCANQPVCSIQTVPGGVDMLMMACAACDFMDVVV